MNQKVKMKPSYLKIAFLDRDGTLIKDYPDEKWRGIKEPEFLEGSIEGLKRLKEMGYDFIIITNQYLINDGIISLIRFSYFLFASSSFLSRERKSIWLSNQSKYSRSVSSDSRYSLYKLYIFTTSYYL